MSAGPRLILGDVVLTSGNCVAAPASGVAHLWLLPPAPSAHLLRQVLAPYLARSPEDIEIVRLPGGKPALNARPGDPALGVSVSHTKGLGAVAVAAGAIGVDAEAPRTVPRAAQIATRWFTRAEAEDIERAGPGRRAEIFLPFWCAKEALAKRHGAGLRLMRGGALAVAPELEAGRVAVLAAATGHIIALALDRRLREIALCAGAGS